jgi:RecA/RadA recombinase
MTQITTSMLESLTSHQAIKNFGQISNYLSNQDSQFSMPSFVSMPPETPQEIEKLQEALTDLSPDVGRGTGRFYDHQGAPITDNWLASIWAIKSLGWSCGKELARSWSQQSSRYTDNGFENAWNSYNIAHKNPITIGSIYKRVAEIKSIKASGIQALQTKRKFNLLSPSQLSAIANTEWVVKGILPEKGLAAIYGSSGSGKSFLALDLMAAIEHKTNWFGFKVKNKPVVYIGLEGKSGFKTRIAAWEQENSPTRLTNFRIIIDNFNLKTKGEVIELANQIIAENMNHGVIVIDTLNQASPGSDENSSVDMSNNIAHLKLLQELTDGLVIIIHHTGKNAAQGLRGHSSLKAALDANIEVTGSDKKVWLLEKSKDGKDGLSRGFALKVVTLGHDSDGDEITSCVVEQDRNSLFAKPEPSGAAQKTALKAIKESLRNTPKISVDTAITIIKPTLTATKPNQRGNRARTIIQGLINSGHLKSTLENDEGVIWLD